ncbi:MAG: DUF1651 domain-containing protein [Synechococcus sp.]
MIREGWLIDANDHWVWRFHRDNSAWVRDPKVFIDRGRQMPKGPPLLKERRYLRKDAAEQLWKSLQTQGWKTTDPARGATEPGTVATTSSDSSPTPHRRASGGR